MINREMPLHVFRGKLLILILSAIFCVLTPGVNSKLKTCDDCGCGVPNLGNPIQQSAVGRLPPPYKYPWISKVLYNRKYICGGSLMNKQYVLTAAHCVDGKKQSKLQVVLSEPSWEPYLVNRSHVVRKVNDVIVHDNYNKKTGNNDIALLKWKKPVTYSEIIRPICIPQSGADHEGRTAIMIGWDRLSEEHPVGSHADRMHEVKVYVYTQKYCRKRTRYQPRHITKNMICAAKSGHGACEGDDGGPLVASKGNNKYELAGIASKGVGCGSSYYPAVYTKVSRYLDWFGRQVRGACFCVN